MVLNASYCFMSYFNYVMKCNFKWTLFIQLIICDSHIVFRFIVYCTENNQIDFTHKLMVHLSSVSF